MVAKKEAIRNLSKSESLSKMNSNYIMFEKNECTTMGKITSLLLQPFSTASDKQLERKIIE